MRTVIAQSGTHLLLNAKFEGRERQKVYYKSSLVLGRANGAGKPDVDLSPDLNVSRRHARIWVEQRNCCIEDLGSKFGTKVDGTLIPVGQKVSLKEGSVIEVGDTSLRINWLAGSSELPAQTETALDPAVEISDAMDASATDFDFSQTASTEVLRRQALLQELPVVFSARTRLDELLQTIMTRAVEIIPGAERGTLLLHDSKTNELSLAAFVSEKEPAVSQTLARRALNEQKGFIWRRGFEGDPGMSVRRHRIESGMYAPLLRHGRTLGVICVDNPFRDSAFCDDDLRLLLGIAHQAAISVASHQFLLTFACHSVRILQA